jgi:hypothetical protein
MAQRWFDTIVCPSSNITLPVGGNMTCAASYTVRPSDVQAGIIYLQAMVTSSSLPWNRRILYSGSYGNAGALMVQGTSQIELDVVASSCVKVAPNSE